MSYGWHSLQLVYVPCLTGSLATRHAALETNKCSYLHCLVRNGCACRHEANTASSKCSCMRDESLLRDAQVIYSFCCLVTIVDRYKTTWAAELEEEQGSSFKPLCLRAWDVPRGLSHRCRYFETAGIMRHWLTSKLIHEIPPYTHKALHQIWSSSFVVQKLDLTILKVVLYHTSAYCTPLGLADGLYLTSQQLKDKNQVTDKKCTCISQHLYLTKPDFTLSFCFWTHS